MTINENLDWYFIMEVRTNMSGVQEALRDLLLLPCLVTKVSGKLQLNPSRTSKGPGPSEMKICVTPLGKEPRSAATLAEEKGNTEWTVLEGYVTS